MISDARYHGPKKKDTMYGDFSSVCWYILTFGRKLALVPFLPICNIWHPYEKEEKQYVAPCAKHSNSVKLMRSQIGQVKQCT